MGAFLPSLISDSIERQSSNAREIGRRIRKLLRSDSIPGPHGNLVHITHGTWCVMLLLVPQLPHTLYTSRFSLRQFPCYYVHSFTVTHTITALTVPTTSKDLGRLNVGTEIFEGKILNFHFLQNYFRAKWHLGKVEKIKVFGICLLWKKSLNENIRGLVSAPTARILHKVS